MSTKQAEVEFETKAVIRAESQGGLEVNLGAPGFGEQEHEYYPLVISQKRFTGAGQLAHHEVYEIYLERSQILPLLTALQRIASQYELWGSPEDTEGT